MLKNTDTKLYVFAYDQINDTGKTGDAAQITCTVDIDGAGSLAALADTNPAEVGTGWYVFDIAAAENNGDVLAFFPTSSTTSVTIDPISIYTDRNSGAGAGGITFTYTLTESGGGDPIANANVWVTSDIAGSNTIASGVTNDSGVVVFTLDAGTVYVWRNKSGFDFTNPDTEVVA